MAVIIPPGCRLSCDYSVAEGIGTLILWLLISIVTLGLGLFVAPYYILKSPINRTRLVGPDGAVLGTLHVEVNLAEVIGHALIWVVLSIVTLGLALLLYQFAVIKRLLNAVVVL